MKKSILIGLAVMVATIAFAQHGQNGSRHMATFQTEEMEESLNLEDHQVASIKKINETYSEKFESLRASESPDNRNAFHKLRKEKEREINAVLTGEQQQKWQNIRQEKRWQKKKQPGRWFDADKEQIKNKLSLSDDQMNRIAAENAKFKEEYHRVFHDQSLSKKDKKMKLFQMKLLHQSILKSTLTDDQVNRWQEFKKEKKDRHKKHR
jgi:hypothetical protein